MSMRNQTVLVTGGLGGIATVVAQQLVEKGANVVIADLAPEAPAGHLATLGAGVVYRQLDVTSEDDWQQTIAATVGHFGKLDALINIAGIFKPGIPFVEMTAAVWRSHIDINLTGTFLGCKHAMLTMKGSGGGAIVNVSSGLAHIMLSDGAAYCVSKAAVLALTRVAAKAGGKHRVRVNAVLPGAIETPMLWSNLRPGQDPKALLQMLESQHPIGRIGMPLDVAQAMLFLCDPDNSFVTGALLAVDGGQLVD